MASGDPFDLGDLFGSFFGSSSEPATRRGADLRIDLELSLEELDAGCTRDVTIERDAACASCEGSGAVRGSPATPCATCSGSGRLRRTLGLRVSDEVCVDCNGIGRTGMRCAICNGDGTEPAIETLSVSIPLGVANGHVLRVVGKGQATRNGNAGDLVIVLHERKHPRLERRGNDLHVDVAIPPGATRAVVPLLRGEHELALPVGVADLVLRGHGMQILGAPPTPPPPLGDGATAPYRAPDTSGRGDLIVHLRTENRGLGAWMKRLLR
jgi:molecular chaperone DnaJ